MPSLEDASHVSPHVRSDYALANRARTLKIIYVSLWLHLTSLMATMDSKMLIYLQRYRGDTARYARTNSRGLVAMMASSAILAPLFTVLSEAHGRKPLLLLGAIWSLLMRILDFSFPVPSVIFFTTAASALASATMQGCMSAFTDLFPGDLTGAAGAMAGFQAAAATSSIIAPVLGSTLAAQNRRLPLFLCVVLTFLEVVLLRMVPETLAEEQRIPMKEASWKKTNPVSFLRIFGTSSRLASLCFVQALSYMSEPMVLNRTFALVHQQSLGWNVAQCGRYMSLSAAVAIPSFAMAGHIVKAMGSVAALGIGNSVLAFNYVLEAAWVRTPWQQFATLPFVAAKGMSTASLSALVMQAGQDAGMRQGELRGCLQSLQNISIAVASPIWAWWYAVCLRAGKPRRFFAAVAMAVLSQGLIGQLAVRICKRTDDLIKQ
eukprot:TRINITY_DN89609_c0_g1_i1.p1 TRINITY_DN89609_c0_g1~~TRINITY_DN89609_c0_g1_i1.p1  ORF type:complete len:433 (+),score=68.38 TRINITY_DN89609_c0_g1_i1:44-1342(+)